MIQPKKLQSEITDGKKKPTLFFVLILIFLASTSWVYGATYLRPLWAVMLGGLPLTDTAKNVLYAVLGGGSGVLLTTFATNRWNAAKLYATTTGRQFAIARSGELISFGADLLFSVVGLLTLMGNLAPDLRIALEWTAVFAFVSLTCIHAILHRLFVSADSDVWQRETNARVDGLKTSERLTYEETVSREGLLIASQQAVDAAPAYAAELGRLWREELIAALPVGSRNMLPAPPERPRIVAQPINDALRQPSAVASRAASTSAAPEVAESDGQFRRSAASLPNATSDPLTWFQSLSTEQQRAIASGRRISENGTAYDQTGFWTHD